MLKSFGVERYLAHIWRCSYEKFLYALMDGDFARATTDIDLLAQGISNDIDKQTFGHRHTSFDDIAAFEDDYASDPVRQS